MSHFNRTMTRVVPDMASKEIAYSTVLVRVHARTRSGDAFMED
jgi:hypothetical protein